MLLLLFFFYEHFSSNKLRPKITFIFSADADPLCILKKDYFSILKISSNIW